MTDDEAVELLNLAKWTISRHTDANWNYKGRCEACGATRLPCDPLDLAEGVLALFELLGRTKMSQVLSLWAVYSVGGSTVARRWEVQGAQQTLTEDHIEGPITSLRTILGERGLYRLDRQPGDDPTVLETWI
jgi:hypothetical protein